MYIYIYMFIKLLFLLIIVIIIGYLAYILYSKPTPIKIKKKVRFFGLPTEIDTIKPEFKTEPIKNNTIARVSPMNNKHTLSENSVDF